MEGIEYDIESIIEGAVMNLKAIISKTSQLEIAHYEDMTATITQGSSTIKVDAKSLTRDESLVVEAIMRVLEVSMLELRHLRDTFIDPEMEHIPEELVPKLVQYTNVRDNGAEKFMLTYYIDNKEVTYKGSKKECSKKYNQLLNSGYKVTEVTPIKFKKIRGGN